MKKAVSSIILMIFLIALVGAASGQKVRASATSKESVMQTLHDLCDAYERGDADFLLKHMAEDFTLTNSDGTITTRTDEMNDLKSGKVKYQLFENRDMIVRLYEKTAVVTGKTVVKGESGQNAFAAEFQFTDTLIWKKGAWRIVSSHATRIASKS